LQSGDEQYLLPLNDLPDKNDNPNPNGLNEDIKDVIKLFKENKQLIAVTGYGKTCFANKFGYELAQDSNSYVYWFEADDLEDGFNKFIKNIGSPIKVHFEKIEKLINQNTIILFIINGLIEYKDIQSFIPSPLPSFLRLLMTTEDVENLKKIHQNIIEKKVEISFEKLNKNDLIKIIGNRKFIQIEDLRSNKFENAYQYLALEEIEKY